MNGPSTHEITKLLVAWNEGDNIALEKLIPLVQSQLRRLAHGYVATERAGHILQTTALENEAYMRLIDWMNMVGTVSRVLSLAEAWLYRELNQRRIDVS